MIRLSTRMGPVTDRWPGGAHGETFLGYGVGEAGAGDPGSINTAPDRQPFLSRAQGIETDQARRAREAHATTATRRLSTEHVAIRWQVRPLV